MALGYWESKPLFQLPWLWVSSLPCAQGIEYGRSLGLSVMMRASQTHCILLPRVARVGLGHS